MGRHVLGIALSALLAAPASSLAQSTDLNAYSLVGSGEVRLKSNSFVAQGDVGSNSANVLLLGGASVTQSVAANLVEARSGAVVYGDAYYNTFVPRGSPAGTVLGTQHSPITLPFVSLPSPPPPVPPNHGPINAAKNVVAIYILPGSYPEITAGSGTAVILQNGTFDVGELVVRGAGTSIRCDVGATCTVRVQSRLGLSVDRINTTGGVPDAVGTLHFDFAGTATVKVGRPGAVVKASFTAVNALVSLQSSKRRRSTLIGRVIANQVRIGSGATVSLTEPGPPVCGNGIVEPPSEQCDPPVDGACPGNCLPDCTCGANGAPVLHSIGPSMIHNATTFGIQAFGAGFLPGAQIELRDKTTSALLATLPATFVSSGELTASVPAGLPVLSGMQRELTARVINPNTLSSGAPDIGHCQTDQPTSPIACTRDADCPSGAGPCVTGDQRLTLINDLVFLNPNSAAVVPGPRGLCDNGARCQSPTDCTGIGSGACSRKLYVTPQQRDEVWVFNTGTRQFADQDLGQGGIQGIPVGDNPFHVEMLDLGGGVSRAWVVNRFEDSFSIIDTATDTELARVTGASLGIPGRLRMETEIEFNRARTRAYLSNENTDEVQVLDISGANRDAPVRLTSIDVGMNPRGMATNAADTRLYVANIQSADISVVDIAPGSPTENQVLRTIAARATDAIVGGRLDGWEAFVISGRAPRGIAFSDAHNAVFVTTIGPQPGPRAGVSSVGGTVINPTVTVIDAATDTIVAHVALTGLDRDRPSCTDPELMALDDARDRLYVTCQGSGTVDVLDTAALTAGTSAERAVVSLPVPTDVSVPTLTLNASAGTFGAKVCAAFTSNPGTPCTTDAQCTGCPALKDGVPVLCCATNNPIGLHNGPRGIAISDDQSRLWVVNQFTTSIATVDVSDGSPGGAFVVGTTSFPGAFGTDTQQRDRRLGQIEFFTDLKKTNVSCASCHIDDHQDGVFFEADVAGPRLRRVLSVRSTRDFEPLLQDQLLPDLASFTDIVVHVERGGAICQPCTELNGNFTCFPGPEGTCTQTSNSENQQNTLYAKGVTFFPNPNLNADGSLSTTVPLPAGRTGDAVRGEHLFDQLACTTCHPEPLFTLDQFRIFNLNGLSSVQAVRMREVGTPVRLPLRAGCQDSTRPTGADGSLGFGVPTLRGIWDTFPLLMSGSAGMQVVGAEPTFTGSCIPGSSGCCTQLRSPLNPGGTPVPEEHLAVATKDPIRAVLTAPLAVPSTGHGTALGLSASDLDALIAYIRSL